jgi:oligopeptide transport system substrate-binding protein
MLRIALIPALLLALLGASLYWSGEGRVQRADFAFVNRGDPITLDINDMSYAQDIRLASALWEGLYTLAPEQSPEPIFGAADSATVSADQKVYTVHIRPDARWSNGDPLLADDFLFQWRRMLESPKEYTYLHYYIKGAKAYCEAYAKYTQADLTHKPPLPDFSTVGEIKLDDRTLQITLTDPVPYFKSLLAFTCFFPMHEPSMRKFKQVDDKTGMVSYKPEFTRPPNLVTNGQYRLSEWYYKRRLRLVANEYYWNRAAVQSKVIDSVSVADNPLAAYRLYQQGDVDWLVDVDGEIAAALLKDPSRTDLHIFPGFGTYFYEFNCQPKLSDGSDNPLFDVRVRQALAMTIDKVPIIRDVARLHQPLATTYIPLGAFAGYHSPPGLPYDVQAARRLLADAGYPDGKGFPRISILFNTDPIHTDTATIIRRQWKDNLGIDVDARGEELTQYKNDLHNHRFVVSRAAWSGDYNDPSTFTDKYLSTSENNGAGWADKRYDAICAAAALEPDPVKRFALFSQAEDRLLSQAPIVPLYTQVNAYLFRDNVKGIAMNALQAQSFGRIRVDRANVERTLVERDLLPVKTP